MMANATYTDIMQKCKVQTHPVCGRLVESAVTRLLTEDGRDTAKQLLRDAAITHF